MRIIPLSQVAIRLFSFYGQNFSKKHFLRFLIYRIFDLLKRQRKSQKMNFQCRTPTKLVRVWYHLKSFFTTL